MNKDVYEEAAFIFSTFSNIEAFKNFLNNEKCKYPNFSEYNICYACGVSKHVFWLEEGSGYVFKMDKYVEEKYCDMEYDIYKKAVLAGLSNMFAEIFPVLNYGERIVYAMKFVEANEFDVTDDYYSRQIRYINDGEEDEEDEYYDIPIEEEQVLSLLEYYYPDMMNDFYKFINKEGINDIHAGNVGYLNNKLVLIDYSGYGNLRDRE